MTDESAKSPPVGEVWPILKGVGKIDGDGWKDVTRKGEVVFVWNAELQAPFAPGQYPRIGNEGWSASTDQYDFVPAGADEVREFFNAAIAAQQARIAELEAENFTLAAGQCTVENGLIGDEHGHFGCSLQSRVDVLTEALKDCANPMRVLQRQAVKEDACLNGAAVLIANEVEFVKGIALAALSDDQSKYGKGSAGPDGGEG